MQELETELERGEVALERTLSRATDLGLASVLLLAPLAMGGRFPVGRLVLAMLVAFTAISWFLTRLMSRRQSISWVWSGAEWIACLAVLLVAVQILPLSPNLHQKLAPEVQRLLPLHSVKPQLFATTANDGVTSPHAAWNRVSLAPQATRGGLAMAIIYVLLFIVVSQRVRRKHEIELMLKVVAMAGIVMAAVGLAQYLFGNGKFLWFIEHPSRDTLTVVKGTFANENHFAHFLALTLGPLLWWLVKEHDIVDAKLQQRKATFHSAATSPLMRRQILLYAGLGMVLIAALLTYSRGGLAVMMVSAIISTALLVSQKRVGKRAVMGVATVMLVAVAAIWIHGQELLARELESLQSANIESLDQDQGRRKIWAAAARAIPDFAIFGSGVGSHRYVYPTYFSEESNVQYTHAESGFLNVLLETGGPGFGLLLVGIGISGYWLIATLLRVRQQETAFLAIPLAASWTVSLVHAVADFNWYIPANMTITLVVVALSTRLWHLSRDGARESRWVISKPSWGVLTCAVAVMAMLSVTHWIGPARASGAWHEYLAWSLASKRFQTKSIGSGRQRNLGLVDPSQPETVGRMISLLEETLKHNPQDGRAHVRMAAMCLRQFELLQARSDNAMTLGQIRDAALSAGFKTHQEMNDWVSKVVGDHRVYLDRALWHSRLGVRRLPTEGIGYMYLAEVAFLEQSLLDSEYDLLQQAYAVRPYSPAIEFVFGRQKMLAGDAEAAFALWKDAFRRGPEVRRRIIAAIAFEAAPQEILEVFQPSLAGLRDLFDYYRREELASAVAFVGGKYVAELERQAKLMSGDPAGQLWLDAQFAHSVLGNAEAAAAAAVHAVRAQPASYQNHFACALRLREAGRLEEAIRELRWCQSRRPDDLDLPQVINELQRELRQHGAQTAWANPRPQRNQQSIQQR